ncbi:hypothetical protein BLOT_008518 [Blomia tropicalis]|nr:hypothetical protein BLOT_008518 [Blomia tropicalis]
MIRMDPFIQKGSSSMKTYIDDDVHHCRFHSLCYRERQVTINEDQTDVDTGRRPASFCNHEPNGLYYMKNFKLNQ